jgi:hypothetical protein
MYKYSRPIMHDSKTSTLRQFPNWWMQFINEINQSSSSYRFASAIGPNDECERAEERDDSSVFGVETSNALYEHFVHGTHLGSPSPPSHNQNFSTTEFPKSSLHPKPLAPMRFQTSTTSSTLRQ